MKIVFFEANKIQQEVFRAAFKDDDLYFSECELSETMRPQVLDADIISVYVCSSVTKSVLALFPSLKLIATRSTGYDHIDLTAAAQRNIVVCNVPVYADITVAEYTFALLLNLSRKISEAQYRVVHEHSFSLENLEGFDLAGKTIGVVGTGNIGKHVVRLAKGFTMQVLAYDLFPDTEYAKKIGFTYVGLDQLLATSDIVTLHVPLSDATYHMINSKNSMMFKKGAYLINTARGGLIENSALIDALDKGIIAGAALDVLQEECYTRDPRPVLLQKSSPECVKTVLENYYLLQHPRVLVCPHNAANSRDAQERLVQTTIENIYAWQQGKPINNVKKR